MTKMSSVKSALIRLITRRQKKTILVGVDQSKRGTITKGNKSRLFESLLIANNFGILIMKLIIIGKSEIRRKPFSGVRVRSTIINVRQVVWAVSS